MEIRMVPRKDDPTRGHLHVTCDRNVDGFCKVSVWQDPPVGAMWHWDGNVEAPTITPSIDCKGGCESHYNLIAGKVCPV